jgi:hypothetical protein
VSILSDIRGEVRQWLNAWTAAAGPWTPDQLGIFYCGFAHLAFDAGTDLERDTPYSLTVTLELMRTELHEPLQRLRAEKNRLVAEARRRGLGDAEADMEALKVIVEEFIGIAFDDLQQRVMAWPR